MTPAPDTGRTAEENELREALAYLTPHRLTNGPVILDAPKMRAALETVQDALTAAQEDRDREKRWVGIYEAQQVDSSRLIAFMSRRRKELEAEAAHLRAENANLRDRVREAEKAMRPFAGSVFNDNGDVTISTGHLTAQDWLAARRFHLSLSPEPQEAGDGNDR